MLPKEKITEANTSWGICGFASSLTALHKDSALVKNVKEEDFKTRLLAEIKGFLKGLEADNSKLLKELETFTKSFGGPFASFKIADFIKKIDGIAVAPGKPVTLPSGAFGIAMTPEAVVKYLEAHWDKKAKIVKGDAKGKKGVILGLHDDDGLKHWVYKEDDKKVYNWGKVRTLADTLGTDCKDYNQVKLYIDVP